jgi:DNA invertase Pin-like site-specific DNA recombinase
MISDRTGNYSWKHGKIIVRPTKNENSVTKFNKILFIKSRMYPLEFRKAVLQLYTYFNSMRKTALALKISIASISRWTKKLEPKQYVRKNIKTSSSMKFLNFFLDEILLKIFSNIRFLNIFF